MHFMPRRILIGSTFGSTDVRMKPWERKRRPPNNRLQRTALSRRR